MFLLIGAGERAGSGLPKIAKGWKDQHWVPPRLYERESPSEQTLLELRMADLLPSEVVERLRQMFGEEFDHLSPDERVLLAAAATEGVVNHARVSSLCTMHPVDITRMLQGLVQNSFLTQTGRGRGAVYHLTGAGLPDPQMVFSEVDAVSKGSDLAGKGADLEGKGADLAVKPSERGSSSHPSTPALWGRIIEGLAHPVIDDLAALPDEEIASLRAVALRTRQSGKVATEIMWRTVSELCRSRFVTLKVLAALLGRQEGYLRQRVLNPMVDEGVLKRAFPQSANDPRQAYTYADP